MYKIVLVLFFFFFGQGVLLAEENNPYPLPAMGLPSLGGDPIPPLSVPEQMGWVRKSGSVESFGVQISTSSCYDYKEGVGQEGRPYIHYGSFQELMGLKRSDRSSTACMMVQRFPGGGMAYYWQAWPAQEYKSIPLPGFLATVGGWF